MYRRGVLENLVGLALPPPCDFIVQQPYDLRQPQAGQLLVLPQETLPNLLTYTLYVAPPSIPCLLDLDVMHRCGTLRAPGLRTLVVRRRPCSASARAAEVAPICPSRLALFISRHLQFDAEVLREVVLDGVTLEDYDDGGAAVEVLESYVHTITVRTTVPRTTS